MFQCEKFLNFIAYLQSEILMFLVFVSLGDLTFFSGDITKILGNMTRVSVDMTLGEMTLSRLDCKPYDTLSARLAISSRSRSTSLLCLKHTTQLLQK